jgi:hypothetical protein
MYPQITRIFIDVKVLSLPHVSQMKDILTGARVSFSHLCGVSPSYYVVERLHTMWWSVSKHWVRETLKDKGDLSFIL